MANMIAGSLLDIGGNALLGESAEDHKSQLEALLRTIKDNNYGQLGKEYFNDLQANYGAASQLSRQARSDELTQNLALREQALPGSTQALRDAMSSVSPLLRGELPQGVMEAFQRAGGASTVGSGFGGSNFGFLNTGLFGARGSLGAIQTGMGLLPALLSSMPNVSAPTTMQLLGNITNPTARAQMNMEIQRERTGLGETIAGAPTRLDVWGQGMKQAAASVMGGSFGGSPSSGGGMGGGDIGGMMGGSMGGMMGGMGF